MQSISSCHNNDYERKFHFENAHNFRADYPKGQMYLKTTFRALEEFTKCLL